MTVMADQAAALRQLMEGSAPAADPARSALSSAEPAPKRRARVVTIASGKGGVGKTNIAVNLAIRLSMLGRKVVLMDADLGAANADVLCNVVPMGTLAHVVAGKRSLRDVLIKAPGDFFLAPGASGLARMADLDEPQRVRLVEQMRELEEQTDLLMIDVSAGVSPNVVSFALGSDQLLVVTGPEPTAITDAYALIKVVCRHEQRPNIAVLVNMVRDAAEARAVFVRLDATCRKYLRMAPRYAGHVCFDPRVSEAVRKRRPFVLDYPKCDAGQCITHLAHRMDRHACVKRRTGLIARMTSWLKP